MSKSVIIKIYKGIVKPVVMFGSESWAVAEMDMRRLGAGERTELRGISGPVVGEGV
jgi:hypothetical protein